MPASPFPDDPNAEACAVTGLAAHARNAGGLVTGWYGSTVVDGETLVVLDPGLPQGPLSDAVLSRAIADGRIYDPCMLLAGKVDLADVPDAVVVALVGKGAAWALRVLDAVDDPSLGIHVPPVVRDGEDDPLTSDAATALFGRARRHAGPDLEAIGSLAAVTARARGRLTVDAATIAGDVLARIRSQEEFVTELRAGLLP